MNVRSASCLLLLLVFSACASGPKLINDPYTWGTETYRDKVLDDWFSCDECVSGELRRVQEVGDLAVVSLIGIVTDIDAGAIPGIATATIAVIESSCTTVFDNMDGRGLTPAETVAECVARYTENLKRRYRARAVEALLAIRTPDACDFLGSDRCLGIPPFPDLEFELPTERSTRTMGVVP